MPGAPTAGCRCRVQVQGGVQVGVAGLGWVLGSVGSGVERAQVQWAAGRVAASDR